ncbi:MAG: YkgJ family cysteine cluster protein, partial [Prolixibacteraceae bacterium]|nr:YkgJ family cysteine cluster protein [Prolixibacteraceae bacterium]
MTSGVSKEEIYTLAKLENISTEEYEKLHIEEDNFDKRKYLKTIPCRYLEEKLCSIYPHRPEECRSYPHTQKKHF